MASSGGGSSSAGPDTPGLSSTTATDVLAPTPPETATELGAVGEPCPPHDHMIAAAARAKREPIDLTGVGIL